MGSPANEERVFDAGEHQGGCGRNAPVRLDLAPLSRQKDLISGLDFGALLEVFALDDDAYLGGEGEEAAVRLGMHSVASLRRCCGGGSDTDVFKDKMLRYVEK